MRPHGLKGGVVVELWTNRPERLRPGSELQDGNGRPLRVESSSPSGHPDRWYVSFAGLTGRSDAEGLRDAVLTAPPLHEPDQLWVHELVGSRLLDSAGRDRGAIVAVEANPASDLLVLEDGGLVPLRFVISHRPGQVVADLPEGLLD